MSCIEQLTQCPRSARARTACRLHRCRAQPEHVIPSGASKRTPAGQSTHVHVDRDRMSRHTSSGSGGADEKEEEEEDMRDAQAQERPLRETKKPSPTGIFF